MRLNETPAESDAKLKAAADAANLPGGTQPGAATHFQLPDRRPYEPKATKKQKDFLWALGVQDVPFLESLGKWQAVAMIDQIKAKQSKEGNMAALKLVLILAVLIVLVYSFAVFLARPR